MKKMILLCLVLSWSIWGRSAEIIYLGLLGSQAPAIEKSFEQELAEQLSAAPRVQLLNHTETQRFKDRIHLDQLPLVPQQIDNALQQYPGDSVVVLWGRVEQLSIKPRREWGIHFRYEGSLSIVVALFNRFEKNNVFVARVKSVVSLPGGWIFFQPLRTEPASAILKSEMTDSLCHEVVQKTVRVVSEAYQNDYSHAVAVDKANSANDPTMDDIFDVPSVQGTSIGKPGNSNTQTPRPASDTEQNQGNP